MYAIIETGGKQYKVSPGDTVEIEKLGKKEKEEVSLGRVLLISGDGKVIVGQPVIAGAKVTAEIIGDKLGKKVIAFKFKRRKGYKVKKGHRQTYTRVKIKEIVA